MDYKIHPYISGSLRPRIWSFAVWNSLSLTHAYLLEIKKHLYMLHGWSALLGTWWKRYCCGLQPTAANEVNLEPADDSAGLLGTCMHHNTETHTMKMKQTGLIDWIIKALGLYCGKINTQWTSVEETLLVKDEDFVYEPTLSASFLLLSRSEAHIWPDDYYRDLLLLQEQ